MTLKTIISNRFDPFLNLAVEDWFFQHCEKSSVVCYLWRNERTVVIGQNQNPYAECNVDLLEGEGGHLMRRTTGGGAVYHDVENLNFTFVAPAVMADTNRNFKVIADALGTYGIKAEVSGRNDMTADGRKFSGSAFHKNATAALHHGTIMIKTDIEALRRYLTPNVSKLLKHGVKSVESRVVNLSELADITVENIMPRIVEAFEKEYGQKSERVDFGSLSLVEEVNQRRAFYASDDWRFGRWRDFKATCKGAFDWGMVEVSLLMDGSTVLDCQIASDALDTDAVEKAKQLILGGERSATDGQPIINDILNLVNERL
ncbi:MAG: lipoate--protein ligase [Bacteroidales bacterium]|nr:lipoate--protein ligase [Bacteroidales bacterium]